MSATYNQNKIDERQRKLKSVPEKLFCLDECKSSAISKFCKENYMIVLQNNNLSTLKDVNKIGMYNLLYLFYIFL